VQVIFEYFITKILHFVPFMGYLPPCYHIFIHFSTFQLCFKCSSVQIKLGPLLWTCYGNNTEAAVDTHIKYVMMSKTALYLCVCVRGCVCGLAHSTLGQFLIHCSGLEPVILKQIKCSFSGLFRVSFSLSACKIETSASESAE